MSHFLDRLDDDTRSILLGIYANGYHICCPKLPERYVSPRQIVSSKRLAAQLGEFAYEALGCAPTHIDIGDRYFDALVEALSPEEPAQ